MPRNCCHVSLAFILKFLNFLQAFVGVSIILYSIWMLDQWSHRAPVPPSPPYPSPAPDSARSDSLRVFHLIVHTIYEPGYGLGLEELKLPAPWFIYSFMGVGIILCCISFIGCIAAESINGCCLCFFTILKIVLIVVEAALVAFIAIDRRWEQDLPFDPTGQLQSLWSFIEENMDICKWVGIAVIAIQALALLLAIFLRAMVSIRKSELDDDNDYENSRARTREPLLNQSGQTSGSGAHSDIWSARMREKYGLNSNDKSTLLNQNAAMNTKSK